MKQNKDEQIRELKESRNAWTTLSIIFFVLMLISSFSGVVVMKHGWGLEQELQSCQDKVLVWTLKVECDYGATKWNTTYVFGSEGLYKGFLENWRMNWDKENCEVIE